MTATTNAPANYSKVQHKRVASVGPGRFRMRSRTPIQTGMLNVDPSAQYLQRQELETHQVDNISAEGARNYGRVASASGYLSNKFAGGRRGRFESKRQTIDSNISIGGKFETGSSKKSHATINAPGPGSYEHRSKFPAGPKFHIQRKMKQDSMFLTKIA